LDSIRQALDATLSATPGENPDDSASGIVHEEEYVPETFSKASVAPIELFQQFIDRQRLGHVQLDQELGRSEERLREWLNRAKETRRRLAEWASDGIG
jgi:hypothetical protein